MTATPHPLEPLAAALDRHDVESATAEISAILDRVRSGDGVSVDLVAVAEILRRRRRPELLIRVAEAGLQQGAHDELWPGLIQGLLDTGARISADAVIRNALTQLPDGSASRLEVLGLAGRSAKDRFLSTRSPDALQAAIDAYLAALHAGGDPLWLAVNVHALVHHGRRHGLACSPGDAPTPSELMRLADEGAADGTDHWAIATWIECHLLVGLPLPVDALVHRLGSASPFVHASLRRQLLEVWELGEAHPAVITLAELILRDGTSGEIAVPSRSDTSSGYEKVFGAEFPTPVQLYRKGLDVARSVCLLMAGSSFPAGTGFVMAGDDLHPSLAGRSVIVTNEHVVPRIAVGDGPRAEELTARFEAAGSAFPAEGVGGFRAVWSSAREDLDITLLVSDELDAIAPPPLRPARSLPVPRPGAHVYVVGHPGGAGLQLSIRGNELIDHDDVRLHYRAPTSRGSSGSPVFDHEWDLVAVHHYGSSNLPALNGRPGRYEGNEGTAVSAVRARLAQEMTP